MEKYADILNKFSGRKILLIGDIMLDKYIYGDVSRISPEAPVPIVKIEQEFYELGGAGNVASNVASLGGEAFLISFVGKDEEGKILKECLEQKRIEYALDEEKITIQKTRVVGKNQQLIRFDKEETHKKIFSENLKRIIKDRAEQAEIILVSDYAKGCITADLMELLTPYNKKIIADPKPSNKELYKNILLITPNKKESLEMSGSANPQEAIFKLKEELNSNILITLSEKGMMLLTDEKTIAIPTYAREVFDVTGAGDSAIATIALGLAANASLEESAILANYAAGISVEKKGTYSVGIEELKNRVLCGENKIMSFNELKKAVLDYKRKNKKVVWTNGCFDLLHMGHIKYLKEAKKSGDVLIVGLDSDESVRSLKGPTRPIQSELERAEILSSMEFINQVTIFAPGGVKEYLKELKPDFYVKGGDYNIDTINQEERKIVEAYGGKVVIVPHVKDKSTTNTIKRIMEKG